jgi:phage terminase large subunit
MPHVHHLETAETAYMSATVRAWKADANLFVKKVLGVTPDRWQERALALVSDPTTRRLAFRACKGPGKTAVLAWIILWFLTCHYESKVGCTSITEANIDTNLWPELLKWMNRSPFLKATFTWTKSQVVRKGNENWFAVKRTWPKSGDQQQADALAGLHADDVMFVLDESGGIPQAVMVTAEAVLSTYVIGHRAVVIQAGNPTHTTGPLYRACTIDKHLWALIRITGDPDDPDRSPRISLE